MTPDSTPVDQSRCPLCGNDNKCGAEKGAGTCWCYSVRIPDEVIERVPPAQRGSACICASCAASASGQSPERKEA